MTSSNAGQPVQGWLADPLLEPRRHPVRFLRVDWDEGSSTAFGPWRISPRQDPLASADQAALADLDLLPDQADANASQPDPTLETDSSLSSSASASSEAMQQPTISDDALAAIKLASYEEGMAAGMAKAQAEASAERERERQLIEKITSALSGLADDPQRFFDPLRKLALHLAEQLVRTELQISGQAISQLVKHCLDQLDQPVDKAVVSLHPDDLQRLKAHDQDSILGLQFEADAHLHRGSVRVSVNDSVVEDLIEHRLETLAHRLLSDPQSWIAQSTLLRDQQRDTPQDVEYRDIPRDPSSDRTRDLDD